MGSSHPLEEYIGKPTDTTPFDLAAASGYSLPPRYTPRNWRTNKFSAELWLQRALRSGHPWVAPPASRAAAADLIFVEANFSLYCRSGKFFSGSMIVSSVAPILPPACSKALSRTCSTASGLFSPFRLFKPF